MPLRRTISTSLALLPLVLCTLTAGLAHAQPAPQPTVPPAPAPGVPVQPAPAEPGLLPVSPAPVTPEPTPAPEPAPAPVAAATSADDLAALKAELAETKQKLDAVSARQDEAELAALGNAEPEAPSEDLLKIYGFADMGVQHQWTKEGTLLD